MTPSYLRFGVLTVGTMNSTIFWDETPCFLVEIQKNVLPVFKVTSIFRVNPEDVGNRFFKIVDSNLPNYMATPNFMIYS